MSSSVPPPQKCEEPPGAADANAAPSHPPTEYLTLSANSEPLRLESLCTNCMDNVRQARLGCCGHLFVCLGPRGGDAGAR
jgi:hypothetical protein